MDIDTCFRRGGTGDGSGLSDGYGYGDGTGDGSGLSDGYGYGDGTGRGDGYGEGCGDGWGDGWGAGWGSGFGIGSGYGYGFGDGYGYGAGYGEGYSDDDPPDPWDAACGLAISSSDARDAGSDARPGEKGDPLQRHYTPDAIAIAATRRLQEQVRPFRWGQGLRLAELHVGGGAWVRAARQMWGGSVEILAVDADSDAIGLRMGEVDRSLHGDLLDPEILSAVSGFDPSVILGNPPFRGAVDHLRAVRGAVPDAVIAWVLQSDLHSVSYWLDALEELRPRYIWPLEGRPWPRSVRGCSVWVWVPRRWVYPHWDQTPKTDRGATWRTYIEPLRWKQTRGKSDE